MRPDQHLAARFRKAGLDPLIQAFERATGQSERAPTATGDLVRKQAVAPISGSLTKPLNVEPNFKDFDTPVLRNYQGNDRFYDMLINAHRNLSDDASSALNARLLLLLANHIGDVSVLQQAIEAAQTIQPSTSYKE